MITQEQHHQQQQHVTDTTDDDTSSLTSQSRSDVVRSDNVCVREEELPSPAFTKSMLAKFRTLESERGGGGVVPLPPGGVSGSPKRMTTRGGATTTITVSVALFCVMQI